MLDFLFLVFHSLCFIKKVSGVVFLLYAGVFGLLLVPNCEILVFFESLLKLQKYIKLDMKSNKRKRNWFKRILFKWSKALKLFKSWDSWMVIKFWRTLNYNIQQQQKKRSFLHEWMNSKEKWKKKVVYSNFIQTKS